MNHFIYNKNVIIFKYFLSLLRNNIKNISHLLERLRIMQLTVEQCYSVCVNPLQKSIKETVEKNNPGCSKEEMRNLIYKELKDFSVNEQYFEYTSINNFLGGYRWFFVCPKCKNRATKLFLPPTEAKNREQRYLCKNCHKLKNQSAIQGQNSMYKKVTRPIKRMKEIEDKIARGHLRPEKIQKLLDEHERLERDLKASPEYRLFSFKKKHDLL